MAHHLDLVVVGERQHVRADVDALRRLLAGARGGIGRVQPGFLDVVQSTLKRGGDINFTGFGKFTVADRGARQGVNPQTGERIQIAASRVPRFSAGSALKNAVKGG